MSGVSTGVSAGVPLVELSISLWFLACLAAADRVRVPARAAHVSELPVFAVFAVTCEPIEFLADLRLRVLLQRGLFIALQGRFLGLAGHV